MYREQLKQRVTKILSMPHDDYKCFEEDFAIIRQLLLKISNIDRNYKDNTSGDSGLILSTQSAAACFDSVCRTLIYWRSLQFALEKHANKEYIRVVYPGCGPFATLVLPLLVSALDFNVKITLIDINPETVDAIQNTIEAIGCEDKVDKLIEGNAAQSEVAGEIDILILECLTAGLAKEGQVAITNRFTPQLSENGILIPEVIELSLMLCNLGAETQMVQKRYRQGKLVEPDELSAYRKWITPLFGLDCNTYQRVDTQNNQIQLGVFNLPEAESGDYYLVLKTNMRFQPDMVLYDYQDGITTPLILDVNKSSTCFGKEVRFYYDCSSKPGVRFERV